VYQVTSWTHQTELPGDLASAALAREFVRFHLIEHGLPGLVEDLRLVTSELATNAIRHAQTTLTVTLQGDNESVLLTVRDGSALAPLPRLAPVVETGGRGLAIVDRLSHRWGTTPSADGGKSVWAWFDKHPIL
jgi:anti-sigma regulatory factor (Ser/Thr protein kinase)